MVSSDERSVVLHHGHCLCHAVAVVADTRSRQSLRRRSSWTSECFVWKKKGRRVGCVDGRCRLAPA
ncbi:hypothetical protein CABS03_10387 [Colletotrichum abscissum]|uniref:Uncharacterized protein n=1 Tax=Colletotrichum abscissum TaxID=1671311 RepID=A0A9P9XCR1_9PEZI|nr:hypothetical protein CABS02_08415 [Colletotrichum abscissum]